MARYHASSWSGLPAFADRSERRTADTGKSIGNWDGSAVVELAARMPGTRSKRRATASVYAASRAESGYFAGVMLTDIVSSPSTRKPGSTAARFQKLRVSNPAPASRIDEGAVCDHGRATRTR